MRAGPNRTSRGTAVLAAAFAAALASAPATPAAPTYTVSHTPATVTALGEPARFRLDIAGDGAPHVLAVEGAGGDAGPFVRTSTGLGASRLYPCRSVWRRVQHLEQGSTSIRYLVSLPPYGRTWLTATEAFGFPPWPPASLAHSFTVQELDPATQEPAGPALELSDPGPAIAVPLGVEFRWSPVIAGLAPPVPFGPDQTLVPDVPPGRTLTISGTAAPLPRGARVWLKWRRPDGAVGVATGTVGARSRFAFHLRLRLPGRYDFTMVHRPQGRFGFDASACGLRVDLERGADPPPAGRAPRDLPPPAWIRAGGASRWMTIDGYCWRTTAPRTPRLCADGPYPARPRLSVRRGAPLHFHLAFRPRSLLLEIAGRGWRLRPGLRASWRLPPDARGGPAFLLATAAGGQDVTYGFAIRPR